MPPPVAQPPSALHPTVPEWFPRSDDADEAEAQRNWETFCANAVTKHERDAWEGVGDPPEGFEEIRTEALRRLSMIQFAGLWSPHSTGAPAENDPMNIFDLFRAWDFDAESPDEEEQKLVRVYLPEDENEQEVLKRARNFDGDVAYLSDVSKRVSYGAERAAAAAAIKAGDAQYRLRWNELYKRLKNSTDAKIALESLPADTRAWIEGMLDERGQMVIPFEQRKREDPDAKPTDPSSPFKDRPDLLVKYETFDDGTEVTMVSIDHTDMKLSQDALSRPGISSQKGAGFFQSFPSVGMSQLQEMRGMERALKSLVAAWTAPYTWFALSPTSYPDFGSQASLENEIYETIGNVWVRRWASDVCEWVGVRPEDKDKWVRTGRVRMVFGPPKVTSRTDGYADRPEAERAGVLREQLDQTARERGKTYQELEDEAARDPAGEAGKALQLRWMWARVRGGGCFHRVVEESRSRSFCWLETTDKKSTEFFDADHLWELIKEAHTIYAKPRRPNFETDGRDWIQISHPRSNKKKLTQVEMERIRAAHKDPAKKKEGPLYNRNAQTEDSAALQDDLLMLTDGPWWGRHQGNEWRINHMMLDGRISDINKEVRHLASDDQCLATQTRRVYSEDADTIYKPLEKEVPWQELAEAANVRADTREEAQQHEAYQRLEAIYKRYVVLLSEGEYEKTFKREQEELLKRIKIEDEERRKRRDAAEAGPSGTGLSLDAVALDTGPSVPRPRANRDAAARGC